MPMDTLVETELREVLAYYDLGTLVDYEKNERGFVNTAYAICTVSPGKRNRYFLRKYKPGIREEELIFEHSLIDHLVAVGAPVARIHRTHLGKSYVHLSEGTDGAASVFYTIFDYLPGEDCFTWVDPILTKDQLSASAAVLARFHIDAGGFTRLGKRSEPKIPRVAARHR